MSFESFPLVSLPAGFHSVFSVSGVEVGNSRGEAGMSGGRKAVMSESDCLFYLAADILVRHPFYLGSTIS